MGDVGDDLLVAADDADGVGGGADAGTGEFATAVEEETLGDIVGLGVNEGVLDELVEVVERNAKGRDALGIGGEGGGNLFHDAADEGAGLGGEDVALLATGEMDVDEGLAEGVGDFGEVEAGLALGSEEGDLGQECYVGGDAVPPSVGGFLIAGSVGGFLEGEIVAENGIH